VALLATEAGLYAAIAVSDTAGGTPAIYARNRRRQSQ
jgi:hypothetical protein